MSTGWSGAAHGQPHTSTLPLGLGGRGGRVGGRVESVFLHRWRANGGGYKPLGSSCVRACSNYLFSLYEKMVPFFSIRFAARVVLVTRRREDTGSVGCVLFGTRLAQLPLAVGTCAARPQPPRPGSRGTRRGWRRRGGHFSAVTGTFGGGFFILPTLRKKSRVFSSPAAPSTYLLGMGGMRTKIEDPL